MDIVCVASRKLFTCNSNCCCCCFEIDFSEVLCCALLSVYNITSSAPLLCAIYTLVPVGRSSQVNNVMCIVMGAMEASALDDTRCVYALSRSQRRKSRALITVLSVKNIQVETHKDICPHIYHFCIAGLNIYYKLCD